LTRAKHLRGLGFDPGSPAHKAGFLASKLPKMSDPIMIEKAELNQILRWMSDIEEAVQLIDKNVEEEPYVCLDQCSKIRKILNKMHGFLSAIKD
jgi:hypothetical protein